MKHLNTTEVLIFTSDTQGVDDHLKRDVVRKQLDAMSVPREGVVRQANGNLELGFMVEAKYEEIVVYLCQMFHQTSYLKIDRRRQVSVEGVRGKSQMIGELSACVPLSSEASLTTGGTTYVIR